MGRLIISDTKLSSKIVWNTICLGIKNKDSWWGISTYILMVFFYGFNNFEREGFI